MTEIRQDRAKRSYEKYLENQQFEEMTDIGERLGYFNEVTLHYTMKFDEATGQNAAYCLSDTKNRAFHDQTLQAMEAGKWRFTGNNAFEALRLRHEHEEALAVDAFGRGELGCNVFIKVSKVPDAVVNNTATVDGYRRDLMRSFVRIYYRTGKDTLSCLLFSLDGNSHQGFSNIESIIGMPLAGRQSEDVLASEARLNRDSDDLSIQMELLKENIILAYDRGVSQETGRKTYAGSQFTDQPNALKAVEGNQDLFEEHWRAINDVAVRVLSTEDQAAFLEDMRRKTAAAIKLRMTGASVGSIGDTDVATEAETGEYGRECATNGMNQTEQSIGLEQWKWSHGTCQVCLYDKLVGPCLVCKDCTEADNRGEDLNAIHQDALKRRMANGALSHASSPISSNSLSDTLNPNPSDYTEYSPLKGERWVKDMYGDTAEVVYTIGIGTAYHFVEDGETGEFVAWLPGSDQSSSIF